MNTPCYARVNATSFCAWIPPGGVVGNMLASHDVNPGSIPGRGIHSGSDDPSDHLDPQWQVKDPWRR